MDAIQTLLELFGRIPEHVTEAVDGLTAEELTTAPEPGSNTIGWLVWHLTRVQDDHVAHVAGTEQVWTADGFVDRFDLPYDTATHGYGQTSEEVGQFRAEAQLLAVYYEAVHARTLEYVAGLSPDDLDRIVDTRWDPPVTLGARLVSVVNDDTQHVGQAAYVRGLLGR